MQVFYLDNDVALELARLLRSMGFTVIVASEIGQAGAGDDAQLLLAAENGWILVTHNRRDFVLLHNAWRRWPATDRDVSHHAGILILPQPPLCTTSDAARHLVDLNARNPALDNELHEWHPRHGWLHREFPIGRGRAP